MGGCLSKNSQSSSSSGSGRSSWSSTSGSDEQHETSPARNQPPARNPSNHQQETQPPLKIHENMTLVNLRGKEEYLIGQRIGSSLDGGTVFEGSKISMGSVSHSETAVTIKSHEAFTNDLFHKATRNIGLDHPNLVGFVGNLIAEGALVVAFEFMDQGSLRDLMHSYFQGGLPESLISISLKELLKGLVYIHQKGLKHKEINAGSCYVSAEKSCIKLGFSATTYNLDLTPDVHPSQTMLPAERISVWAAAPEVFFQGDHENQKSDIWLIGITAIELAFGGIRVQNRERLRALLAKTIQTGEEASEGNKISDCLREMVGRCLTEDPSQRPTAEELLEHPFFNGCNDMNYFLQEVTSAINQTN